MHGRDWQSWSDKFDAEWRDEVDPPGASERHGDGFGDFVTDVRDLAQSVVECAVEPLRAFAATVSGVVAFGCATDGRPWRVARPWRAARRGRRW